MSWAWQVLRGDNCHLGHGHRAGCACPGLGWASLAVLAQGQGLLPALPGEQGGAGWELLALCSAPHTPEQGSEVLSAVGRAPSPGCSRGFLWLLCGWEGQATALGALTAALEALSAQQTQRVIIFCLFCFISLLFNAEYSSQATQ